MIEKILQYLLRKWQNREALKTFGAQRSSEWKATRDSFLKKHPLCEVCRVKAEIVHHILPYHISPENELLESNLISLCNECHLVLAHLKSFKRWDRHIRETARLFRTKIDNFYL